jgi:hypothetical protein
VSYLDIAAPDSLGIEKLSQLLLQNPTPTSHTTTWSAGSLSLRFSSQPSSNPSAEFDELRRHAVMLLRPRQASITRSPRGEPLKVVAQDVSGSGTVYQLDFESSTRLRAESRFISPAKLHIAYDNMDALKKLWGEEQYHVQIVLILTSLPQEVVAKLGGYEIEHKPGTAPHSSEQLNAGTRDIPGQLEGDWILAQSTSNTPKTAWPTGALLLSDDRSHALDLVFVESAWFPMSEAALYTYTHSFGLMGGESWRFVARNTNEVFEVSMGTLLTKQEVAVRYGREAALRSRPDYKTVQLLVRRISA